MRGSARRCCRTRSRRRAPTPPTTASRTRCSCPRRRCGCSTPSTPASACCRRDLLPQRPATRVLSLQQSACASEAIPLRQRGYSYVRVYYFRVYKPYIPKSLGYWSLRKSACAKRRCGCSLPSTPIPACCRRDLFARISKSLVFAGAANCTCQTLLQRACACRPGSPD